MERMRDRLAARWSSQFVGRAKELALVGSLLASTDEGAVVFLHGPGGVGKTTLLRRITALADDAGRRVVRLDGRDVAPLPSSFLAALAAGGRAAGGLAADDDHAGVVRELAEQPGLTLLIDTTELLGPLDRWLREDLLPALGADTIAVFAGREPPSVGWRTDPGWRGLVHSLRLDNLSADDSRALLALRGVPPEAHATMVTFTRGHPLALALLADVAAQGGADIEAGSDPAVVAALLGVLVDSVPSPRHRAALEVCAQVLTTTEPLLAAVLGGDDAHDLFSWLSRLSIVETGRRGLFPHDLARDTLGSELRWRHPEQHAAIHRKAGAYYRELFYAVDAPSQQQVLVEYVFLHRESPVLGPFVNAAVGADVDLRSLAAVPVPPGDEASAQAVRAMVAHAEGEESAALLDHWLARQPESVLQVMGPEGERVGLIVMLSLTEVSAEDQLEDPAVAAVVGHLRTLPSLGPGEVALLCRFWMTADGYQEFGPIQMFITLHFGRTYLATRGLAQSYVYYADPELWASVCAYYDMHRIRAADFSVGVRTYGVYGHDWRTTPPLAWLTLLGEREVTQAPRGAAALPDPTSATFPPPARLSGPEFAIAVRAALRGLGRADGLRDSPLLGTRLVLRRAPDGGPRARADALRAAVGDAAARLEASPRDRQAFRALHHTYLQPAASQAAAAELLDLPMTTYRRHLARGIERITELLLAEELDG
ncbi:MAG: ATP-binding protein [Actinomycetes bacterium]